MKNNRLPNFLIVGVARCGTTSLFHYMDQHPQIGFSKIKEPKFFSSQVIQFPQTGIGDHTVDEKMVTNWESYQNLFSGIDNLVKGEASSDYFYYHEKVTSLIKENLGDIPIIISIRNPYERSFSAYNNLIRDGRETLSFIDALHAEKDRIKDGWDWMWHYSKGSLYADGISNYYKHFSKVKVILFDDLENPIQVLNELIDFLGLDQFSEFDTNTKYSPSGKPRNFLIKLISSRNIGFVNFLRRKSLELIPRRVLEDISKGFFKKDTLPSEVIDLLSPKFEPDIKQVETLIGRDLSGWKVNERL